MSDLHEKLRTAIEAEKALAEAATPGPWFGNSYSAVFSSPLSKTYDAWSGPLIDAGHTLERKGECPPCGDWKVPPYVPGPGYGHGCRHFGEDYDRDPLVATVPAHHGDTAIRRHAMDAELIAHNDPTRVLRRVARDLKVLERHTPCGGHCVTVPDDDHEWWCHRCSTGVLPCPEILDLADDVLGSGWETT